MMQILFLVFITTLLSSTLATTNSKDYSCYHYNSWLYNKDADYNSVFSAYTGILTAGFKNVTASSSRRRLDYAPNRSPVFRPVHAAAPPGTPPPGSTPPPGTTPPPGAPTVGGGGTPPPTSKGAGCGGGGQGKTYVTAGWRISFSGIPDYTHTMTASDITTLNSRPKASADFKTGATTAKVGDKVIFGKDIGYNSPACDKGYWPPGPECPIPSESEGWMTYTLTPAPEQQTKGCYVPGNLGYVVSGAAIFNWGDANNYNNQGVWHNLALKFENYDMDFCLGHAAMGIYHHHSHSPCLQKLLNDTGNGHSPIYGWAYDGFPIYGPYQAKNKLAVSCWQARDYSSSSPTGCSDGKRSCLLKDEYDYTQGTKTASSSGPDVGATLTTQSSNTIIANSGVYYEDYFWNSTCSSKGGVYLNQFNGHDHDGLGFHYHLTIDSSLTPTFPYTIGPKFYGCQPNGFRCIQTVASETSSVQSVCGVSSAVAFSQQQCATNSFSSTYTNSDSSSDSKSSFPMYAIIIIVVVGGILLIALAAFLYYRNTTAKVTHATAVPSTGVVAVHSTKTIPI